MDFALNQKTASRLDFAAFLDLAADLGCVGVEPRNDLGRPLFDGIAPGRAAEMARERGLRLLGLSEVYPFNDWNAERRAAVAALIEAAEAAGAETISLIPARRCPRPGPAARAAALRAVVAEIAPMLAGTRVVALLEPIGFTTCSMKFQREAAAAIESLDLGDRFGIVHDTFQHASGEGRGLPRAAHPHGPYLRHIRRLRRSDRRAGCRTCARRRKRPDRHPRPDAPPARGGLSRPLLLRMHRARRPRARRPEGADRSSIAYLRRALATGSAEGAEISWPAGGLQEP